MNAREYYYTNVAPTHKGKSYQQIYQKDYFSSRKTREVRKYLNHIPKYSNCRLLEGYVRNLIKTVDGDIKTRIENIFVAKIREFKANAGAVINPNAYYGDLVYFYVGLSDYYFQYSILMCEMLEVREGKKAKIDIASFFININMFVKASKRWVEMNNLIRLTADDVVVSKSSHVEGKAAAVASYTDEFILAHEISHHFLGHTGKADICSSLLNEIPDRDLFWIQSKNDHNREFEADALGVLMMIGLKQKNDDMIRVALGSLVTLGALIILEENKVFESETHPPAKMRFSQCKKILEGYIEQSLIDAICDDIEALNRFILNHQI